MRFPKIPWGVVTPAAEHFPMATVAAALGADVLRTGFEDATNLPDGFRRPGRMRGSWKRRWKIVHSVGREGASPSEARIMFQFGRLKP